jgi:hypothetical protein
MENKTRDQVESLFEKFTEYVETRVNLYKLQAVDKSSDVISSVVSKMLVVLVFAMFVFIINIGIALLLGELLGKAWYGFFILSGFYLITGIIFNYMNSKWFKEPLTDKIIQKFLK